MAGSEAFGDRVVIVVVTWNSAGVLPGLLDSLQHGMAGLDWRLVIADNASDDDTAELVRDRMPSAAVLQTGRNAGYAAAINLALAHIDAQIPGVRAVLVCNPDVRMQPGCAAALVAGLNEPGTGVTAPLLHDRHGQTIRSLRREPTIGRILGEAVLGARRSGRFARFGELVAEPAAYQSASKADWALGCLLAVSTDCLRACGRWDESFFLYSEETEFALRARDLGFATRLAPAAEATHLEGASKDSPRLWTLLTLNRVRLYRQRHGRAATAAFWAAVLLRELSRAALGRAVNRAAALALLSPKRLRAMPGP